MTCHDIIGFHFEGLCAQIFHAFNTSGFNVNLISIFCIIQLIYSHMYRDIIKFDLILKFAIESVLKFHNCCIYPFVHHFYILKFFFAQTLNTSLTRKKSYQLTSNQPAMHAMQNHAFLPVIRSYNIRINIFFRLFL